jgi:hypothetical protein
MEHIKSWGKFNENNSYKEVKVLLSAEYSESWGDFIKNFIVDYHIEVDFEALDYRGQNNEELEVILSGYASDVDECILDMDHRGMINTIESDVDIQ